MTRYLEVQNLQLNAGQLSLNIPQLRFDQGKTTCVIGRSGSGKSLFAAALSGLPLPGLHASGDILLDGQRTAGDLWRDEVFVLPQEPAVALDPTMSIGKQVAEVFRWRRDPDCPWAEPESLCAEVGLTARDLRKFPEQLSGGMQQRVMIAMALAARAAFVIADEPTKGLDTENKARTIDLFGMLQTAGRGLIIITHDLDVARGLADDVVVFDHGNVAEQGTSRHVLSNPQSDAACALIENEPAHWPAHSVTNTAASEPILDLQNVHFGFSTSRPLILDANLAVKSGEIVGLYGPSGAGKSTFGDLCLGLHAPDKGSVKWLGEPLTQLQLRQHRTRFQKLFQNPVTSFPPNLRIGDVFDRLTPETGNSTFSRRSLMERLGIDPSLLDRRPGHVSGGELQRLAIVRVLLAEPRFVVCDEPSSRLDMSIQKMAVDVISEYVANTGAAVLFISHDLTALEKSADRIFEFTKSGCLIDVKPPNRTEQTEVLLAAI